MILLLEFLGLWRPSTHWTQLREKGSKGKRMKTKEIEWKIGWA
jgi:hypothetical protein